MESEEELDFVHVISDYYQGIYVVDLEKDLARSIKVPRYFEELLQRAGHCQSKTLDLYCQELMDPDYVASFRAVTDYDNLRRKTPDPAAGGAPLPQAGRHLAAPAGVRHARLHPGESEDPVGL